MDYADAQRRLMALGYDVGPTGADGVPGRNTARAFRAFQAANALAATGILDAATARTLGADKGAAMTPPWLVLARSKIGLRETPGPRHTAEIVEWVKRLGGGWADDETPWCGAFVGYCLAASLPDEPLPNNPFGARNWLRFGVPCRPQPGAVLVFWRGRRDGWQGHVGFCAAEDREAFHVLGGNQANRVSIARIARARLLCARWPAGIPLTQHGTLMADAGGALSTNEA